MVFFTCSQCGQSVKKNQVESHCSFQCRGCQSLSCMDCGKMFWGDEYKQHIKCITENEKYGGKGYQAKPSSNKGEVKQEKWIEHVKNTIATKKLSGPLSNILNQMIQYSNIPRKRSKFENFLKNSLKFRDPKLLGDAWEIFAQGTLNESNSTQSPSVNGMNGTAKRPLEEEDAPSKKPCINGNRQSHDKNLPQSFNWTEVIERILSNSDGAMPLATLRKMVIAEYRTAVKDSMLGEDELKKKLRHHLSNSELFNIGKDK